MNLKDLARKILIFLETLNLKEIPAVRIERGRIVIEIMDKPERRFYTEK
jgi:hypothetical protein